jgi:colanic acid/amylovoran biosynthesis glycosyltransferase
MMRIAFFVGGFPLISETFILRQISGLIDLGHEVDIYAGSRPPREMPVHEEVEAYGLLERVTYMNMPPASGYYEMPIWPIAGQTWLPGSAEAISNEERALQAVPNLIHCLSTVPGLTFKVLDPAEYGHQALSLSSLYRLSLLNSRTERYDVAHAHFGPIGNAFRFVKELWKIPFIVTFHGYDFSTVPRGEDDAIYHRLFDTVDAVTVNSEYVRRRVMELGCPAAKIHKLHVGLDLKDFPPRARTPRPGEPLRILTLGRLVEKKGIEYSIRSVAQVHRQHPQLRYDIIGDGPLRAELEALIVELGAEGYIVLHGAQNGDYVRRAMADAHLFILSSVTASDNDQEGTPVSLMEAQASGLPVLSTWHSGIPEVVSDGVSGFLVPERNVEELTRRLAYLVERPEMWPELGRQGRRHIEENFDISKLNDQLVGLYEGVVRSTLHQ